MNKPSNKSEFLGGAMLLTFAILGFYWGYLVIKGIFVPLLFAALFAVVFYPVYHWFLKKTNNKMISSLLCCLILVLAVAAFISFVVYLAVGEVVSITKVFTQSLDLQRMEFLMDQEQLNAMVEETIQSAHQLLSNIPFIDVTAITDVIFEVLKKIPEVLQSISSQVISLVRIGFDSAARLTLDLVIFFISFFFLLIDGKKFMDQTYKLLPINALHERQISKRFSGLCYAWIVVNLMLAFIQGSLAAIGFAIIGVPSPLVWGIVTMLASFIPFLGSALIWGSIALIYLILGEFGSTLFIVLWGLILISSSDNILRPFLLKEGIQIHPLVVFLAVLGGFFAFNVPGLIIGPLIMVFLSTLLYIYQLEFAEVLEDYHYSGRKKK